MNASNLLSWSAALRSNALLLCVCAWLASMSCACEEGPPATEVLVVIDTDDLVEASLSRLEVSVFDGSTLSAPMQARTIYLGNAAGQYRLPVSFSVAATKQEDTSAFRVLITGYDAQSRVLVEQQVLSSFHPNHAGLLDVHLFGGCPDACRENGAPGTRTCNQSGMCGDIPVRNELPAALSDPFGGYTVVMMGGAQDSGVTVLDSDGGRPQEAGAPTQVQPLSDAAVVTQQDAGSAIVTPDAAGPAIPMSDSGTPPPLDAAADASSPSDARVDASSVDAARDATLGLDANADASNPDAGKFFADPVIPALPATCPAFQSGNTTVAGMTMQLWAGVPTSTKGSLIVYWHGTGSSSGEATRLPIGVRTEILDAGGLIVSPQGSLGTGIDTSGNGVWRSDDYNVIDTVVACAVRDHNIDPRRIYVTGLSSGGLHAGAMAFFRAKYVAAISANSGGLANADLAVVEPGATRVPPGLTMHGGASDQVQLLFSATSQTLYTNLKSRSALAINCDHGGGHAAAGADLQTAAWQFMKDHPFGVTPEPYAAGLPVGGAAPFPAYCSIK